MKVTSSRLHELEQERLQMQEERELLSRQQDAMREHAGPRELRTYPRIPSGKKKCKKICRFLFALSQEVINFTVERKIWNVYMHSRQPPSTTTVDNDSADSWIAQDGKFRCESLTLIQCQLLVVQQLLSLCIDSIQYLKLQLRRFPGKVAQASHWFFFCRPRVDVTERKWYQICRNGDRGSCFSVKQQLCKCICICSWYCCQVLNLLLWIHVSANFAL